MYLQHCNFPQVNFENLPLSVYEDDLPLRGRVMRYVQESAREAQHNKRRGEGDPRERGEQPSPHTQRRRRLKNEGEGGTPELEPKCRNITRPTFAACAIEKAMENGCCCRCNCSCCCCYIQMLLFCDRNNFHARTRCANKKSADSCTCGRGSDVYTCCVQSLRHWRCLRRRHLPVCRTT